MSWTSYSLQNKHSTVTLHDNVKKVQIEIFKRISSVTVWFFSSLLLFIKINNETRWFALLSVWSNWHIVHIC